MHYVSALNFSVVREHSDVQTIDNEVYETAVMDVASTVDPTDKEHASAILENEAINNLTIANSVVNEERLQSSSHTEASTANISAGTITHGEVSQEKQLQPVPVVNEQQMANLKYVVIVLVYIHVPSISKFSTVLIKPANVD